MAGDHVIRAHAVDLAEAGVTTTKTARRRALRVVTRYDTVHLHVDGRPTAFLNGRPAQLVSELADMDGPAHWEVVAGEMWPRMADKQQLRSRWDRTLERLRKRLAAQSVCADLVRSAGAGRVELFLYPDDELRIESR